MIDCFELRVVKLHDLFKKNQKRTKTEQRHLAKTRHKFYTLSKTRIEHYCKRLPLIFNSTNTHCGSVLLTVA